MNYNKLATKEILEKTINNLTANGFLPEVVNTKEEALEKIKSLIPTGAEIMNGSSTTLNQIGFIDFLKSDQHKWNNVHETVINEKDPLLQQKLRKQAVLSEFYLGSAHAITESGEIVVASNSGSQLPHLVFTSQNIILVVGAQKIVGTVNDALERIRVHVFPLEDARMKSVGMGGSFISKELILRAEPSWSGRKFHIIFVNEILGF